MFIALALSMRVAHAAPPEFMTYQGYLVDGNGNMLASNTPANYPVIFRIFTASTGGTRMWSEQQIVTVDKGNFSVILGEGTPVSGEARPTLSSVLAGPSNSDRYMSLSVTVGATTTEMLPRLRMLPAPYAFTATSANSIVNPAGAAVLSYANSRVEVVGNLFSSGVISGNGSGLTGLTASQIPALSAASITSGTLPDAVHSANIARRDVPNNFTGNQSIVGNVAITGSGIPMNFGTGLGDKIALYGSSGNHYGFGVQPAILQIHTDGISSDVGFGYGSSGAFTETMRIKGNGNVGIGTTTPTAKLEVNGGVKVSGANVVEFGAGVAGKEGNAGKIGYGFVTSNALDIIGGGVSSTTRKVKIFAESGTDFTGGIRARGGAPGVSGANNNGYAFAGNGGDNDSGMFSSADGQVEFYSNGTERMRINSLGRVGINTATPRVPLDVVGGVNYTVTATQADTSIDVLDAFGHANGPSAVTKTFSILAEQHVGAVGFVATSDRRIKTGIVSSSKEKDLAAIQQLRVTDYGMKDKASHGAARRKGFIAQEVEKVIPQAVSQSINFVPDIYAFATNATYTASTRILALSVVKPHELKVGNRVRLQLDSERRDLTVAQVLSANEFVVEGCEQSPAKVFVYGREVDDFRAVDYDQIFTTSVGAIQELARRVQELESKQSGLTQSEKKASQTAALEQENASLRARVDQQEQRLAALESLIQAKVKGVQQASLRTAGVKN